MKPYLLLTFALALGLASGAHAQTESTNSTSPRTVAPAIAVAPTAPSPGGTQTPTAPANSTAPITPAKPEPQLQITATERQYFDFGYSLSKAAFAYADLAKQSTAIPKTKDRMEQIKLLANLAPLATRDRAVVRENLNTTLQEMHNLHATATALAVVKSAVDEVDRPIVITADAKDLSALNPDAGHTLAALNEFERISGLTENPTIATWLQGPLKNRVGNVWYAEGLIAGVAEVASAQDMPDLLPSISEISTDLRGLRDWLLLRMPEQPTAEQTTLRTALDDFLKSSAWPKQQDRPVSHAELIALGNISRQLQAQVLTRSTVADTPSAPTQTTSTSSAGTVTPRLADAKRQ